MDSGSEYAPSASSSSDDDDNNFGGGHKLPDHQEDVLLLEKGQGRKRKKNEESWMRNIRKRKRAAGEQYRSVKGKVVPAKEFNARDCNCPRKCHSKFSLERRADLFKNFYALGSHSAQTAYIFGQVKVQAKQRTYSNKDSTKRENTRLYFLPDDQGMEKQVCKNFFKESLGVSDGRITRALATKKTTGTPKSDQRGKQSSANKCDTERIEGVRNFINKFPVYESHYSRAKNPHRKYLAPDLDLTKMYRLYKSETENPVSFFIFRRVFNDDFNLKFHAPLSDSCRKCDAFDIKIKAAKENGQDNQQLLVEQELHHRKAEAARLGMKHDAEAAKSDENLTVISFDLMKTLPTPVISTGVAYYKRQLWTFCFGIHNLENDLTHMYLWDESVASRGPQEIGSCIAHYIKNNVRTSRLIMYSDQCGGQNRNFKIAALCSYIVSSEDYTVNTIDHKFLVSGHSYLPNDQDFGLVEKNKKHYKNIYVPSDWAQVVKETKKRNPFEVVVMQTSDFFSTKGLENALTHRKKSETGEKLEWLRLQWLRYEADSPGVFQFKYSNNEDVIFNQIDMRKRGSNSFQELARITPLFDGTRSIPAPKYKDLLCLLEYIPPVHHDFYKQLPHSTRVDDNPFGDNEDENNNE